LPEPEYARSFHFAGTDHIGDMPLLKDTMAVTNPTNPLDSGLLSRAAFVNLEGWVCDGIEPPPSRVPRIADGSAVTRTEALPAVLLEFAGSVFPFARTADERAATGDARPAITERYADRGDYLDRVRKAAAELVAERYLLAEDEDAAVEQAARLYDRLNATDR